LLAAVVAVESGYRIDAVSSKGARGLMQLMPATAKDLGVSDPFDARQNIDAGARYLRQLLDEHAINGKESYVRALAAYNAGTGRVSRYKGLPPYKETVNYVKRVLKIYASPESR
ncbi:MAG TPA: lytic transglycosylase domain-containing protein, partial [Candidatus Polarisedimenticolia bacterium]|nr:lytic transglycosylase domain-containing protein [Candidatus Polarisedimenticolia bacterium]